MSKYVGWISLQRKFARHELWTEPRKFSRAEAWIYLLIEANWDDKEASDGKLVRKGEVLTSIRKLSSDWMWSKDKVRRFLKSLQLGTMIELQTGQDATQIRILNYQHYQNLNAHVGTQTGQEPQRKRVASKTQHNNKQLIINNNTQVLDLGIPIPEKLNTAKFREAWQLFLSNRKLLKKPVTPISAARLLSKLERMGLGSALAAIDESIANGWQGIFEQPNKSNSNQPETNRAKMRERQVVKAVNGDDKPDPKVSGLLSELIQQKGF